MQTIVLYLCYTVLILLFSSAYNTSLIYCFVIWCLHTNKRRPCSSTLSGHPSSSFHMLQVYFQKNKENYEWRVLENTPRAIQVRTPNTCYDCAHVYNVSWSRHVHFLPRDPGHLPPEHLDERPAINSHNLIRILRVRKSHRLAVVRMREGMNSRLRGYM